MRKSWVRLSLGVAGAFVLFGQASAQTVNFWYNSLGDPAANQPGVIDVVSGTSVTLSIYDQTANFGPISGVSVMFGYSTTTTGGADPSGANRSDAGAHMADVTGYTWIDSAWSNIAQGTGGGEGPSDGTLRPWGYFATAGDFGNPVGGDGTPYHVSDITLSILATPGTDIPISIWGYPANDTFASAVLDSTGANEAFGTTPYTGTLHVVAAPEPASMAALGIGVLALLRRRRR